MTSSTLQNTAADTIARHKMLTVGDHVLVAVSGGPDSGVLHVLHSLQARLSITLTVAHLNHRLRGQASEDDAAFVVSYAESLGLSCIVESEDVQRYCDEQGVSIETGARTVRYAFLDRVAVSAGAQKIATGHTADDQAETILMRLLRGSGADGLSGIRPVRDGRVIRPLLDVARQEVMAYLEANGLSYCLDETNIEIHHLRNRIRHTLLPTLQEDYNPEIVQALCRIGEVLRTESAYMERETERAFEEVTLTVGEGYVRLDARAWSEQPPVLQRRLIRYLVQAAGGRVDRLTFDHIEQARTFMAQETSGKLLDLPDGLIVERQRDRIVIHRGNSEPFDLPVAVPGVTAVPGARGCIDTRIIIPREAPEAPDDACALFDMDLIQMPVQVRSRRTGDRIAPNGMTGTKSIKALFNERHIPRVERDSIPIVVSASDILWVVGHRRSRLARVSSDTEKVLMMTWREDAPNHL